MVKIPGIVKNLDVFSIWLGMLGMGHPREFRGQSEALSPLNYYPSARVDSVDRNKATVECDMLLSMLLGISMAAVSLSIGLVSDQGITELTQPLTHANSESLILEIQTACDKQHQSLSKLTAICVTCGPGGYTSLRIGIAVAKTIAYVNKVPLYPVSTLAAIAHQHAGADGLLATLLPARTTQVNTALWAVSNGLPRRLTADFVATEQPLRHRLSAIGPTLRVVGEGPMSGLAVIAAAKANFFDQKPPSLHDVRPHYTYSASIGGVPAGFDKKYKAA